MYTNHRNKLIAQFNDHNISGGLFVIKGGKVTYEYDSDNELPFIQESNFKYLFGIEDPDVVGCLDIRTGKAWILIHEAHSIWTEREHSISFYIKHYQLDAVYKIDRLKKYKIAWDYDRDHKFLKGLLAQCRVIKSPMELELMRYVNKITCDAHIEVMKMCKPNVYEYDLEALFKYLTYVNGPCRYQAYLPICASGKNSAILHYSNNNKLIKNGELVLVDMGAMFEGYRSDVTSTFPANGKFTKKQADIYNLVLETSYVVIQNIKPDITWHILQTIAKNHLLTGLMKIGLVYGTFDELMKIGIIDLFFPHAIGHYIGLETHDVLDLPENYPFQPDMVIAIEPGIYFMPELLKLDKYESYLNLELLQKYWTFGGVRIENNLIVTSFGVELLTNLPREIKDIEAIMKK